jgi:hypothetical protein
MSGLKIMKNNVKGKIVSAYSLGFKEGGFRCQDCFMKMEPNSYTPGPRERMIGAFDEGVLCPVCSSFDKTPTPPSMSQEEIEAKKEEIKKRLI